MSKLGGIISSFKGALSRMTGRSPLSEGLRIGRQIGSWAVKNPAAIEELRQTGMGTIQQLGKEIGSWATKHPEAYGELTQLGRKATQQLGKQLGSWAVKNPEALQGLKQIINRAQPGLYEDFMRVYNKMIQ
jgi:hypothetical protein